MSVKTVEAGNRLGRGPGLGVEKACVLAAFDLELTPPHLALQVQRIVHRHGLTLEHARAVAELAFRVEARR